MFENTSEMTSRNTEILTNDNEMKLAEIYAGLDENGRNGFLTFQNIMLERDKIKKESKKAEEEKARILISLNQARFQKKNNFLWFVSIVNKIKKSKSN